MRPAAASLQSNVLWMVFAGACNRVAVDDFERGMLYLLRALRGGCTPPDSFPKRYPLPVLLPEIRNAVRALIIDDGAVLMLEKWDQSRGQRFALPGGAQDAGEPLLDALQRECLEEIGTQVEVAGLRFCCDYFKQRNSVPPSQRHVVEFVFACAVPDGYRAASGSRPDKHQVGVRWLAVEALPGLQLTPDYLLDLWPLGETAGPAYAGTFHGQ